MFPRGIDVRASNGRPGPVRREKRAANPGRDGRDESAAGAGTGRDEATKLMAARIQLLGACLRSCWRKCALENLSADNLRLGYKMKVLFPEHELPDDGLDKRGACLFDDTERRRAPVRAAFS
jgi:hypothetical protein